MALPWERLSKRHKTCLIVSVLFLIFGILHTIVGIVVFTVQVTSAQCTKSHGIILGNCFMLAGLCGLCAYSPKRARSYSKQPNGTSLKMSRPEKFPVVVFVVACLVGASFMYMDIDALDCAIRVETSHNEEVKPFPFFGVAHVVCLHVGHLLAAIGVGLACPDLWGRGNTLSGSSIRSSPLKEVKCKSSKQALHLPEAKTHIQEAVGTGDKITVVSLPQTDGIVYAVPEEQYVVRRGEATYMAPTGNTKLTAFFPTYNRVSAD